MATIKSSTPPPVIGKMGRYTVFLTPPSAPKPADKITESLSTMKPPPVQSPPQQFEKSSPRSSGSVFGFFWNAVSKVQDAHSSLDEYLADLFGLNQSKYQWALNDYYESNGMEKEASKSKDLPSKVQHV